MKKLLFLVSISIAFFSSCIPNPTEDPDPPVAPFVSYFKADYSGQTFFANTTQAIVNDDYLSITGMKNTGEFFQITLPNPEVGTYTWDDFDASSTFVLLFSQGSGNVPYMGASDDSGPYADFPSYTDTAELVISSIDKVNKTVTGSFKFTGVRFADGGTSVDTKEFTNGFFALNYLDDAPPGPEDNSFEAVLDGEDFIPTNVTGVSSSGRISLIGRRGTIENISLSLINTVTPGTYPLTLFGDYTGRYVRDMTPEGSSFASDDEGSVTITSHDTTNHRIIGTFDFPATSFVVPGVYEITEGAFDITYIQ